ncbi:MAG TPA: GDP-mannose 4,6-dehydratase [Sphingomicrobium sp.]|nr:GDP-mannose 4,6-dehydratase [Sphingomicrobium sp.]
MNRTLLTGAAGFTGRYLARLLAERGDEVHGLVHGDAGEPIDGATGVYSADLAELASVEAVVAEVRPTHVVHLAAIAFVAHDDVNELYRSNIVGTRQLLEALSRMAEPPRSILVASSANIYGNSREGVLDETLPPAPANDYGISKVAVESLAHIYSDRLPLTIVRPFNYTGRGQSANFVIPKIVEHARERTRVIELGNLDVFRDFSDVRTVVDSYARLLDEPRAIAGTFNIASGEAVSLREIIKLVERLSKHSFEVKVNPAFVRANDVRSLCGSAARVESVIGPLDRIPLEETLRWMLEA